jgi:cyclic pyranopterin monophosphate synthase
MADERRLTHLGEDGGVSMVDVGGKSPTVREAVAEARVRMSAETLDLLRRSALPKGDVLTTAKVAGILAAKATPALIPLAHPLEISQVEIAFEVTDAVVIRATVRCEGKTGVEMEAMTACAVTALTIYDMVKSAEKGVVIEQIRLLAKSGGKSGLWRADE